MKSIKHCKFKYFLKKFWFIFQKQRKSTIQNLNLIFLCGMPGLRWGPKSGTYESKFSPEPDSFQNVLMLFIAQQVNHHPPLTPPFIFCKSPWVINSEVCKHTGILMWIFSSKIFKVTHIWQYGEIMSRRFHPHTEHLGRNIQEGVGCANVKSVCKGQHLPHLLAFVRGHSFQRDPRQTHRISISFLNQGSSKMKPSAYTYNHT